jgi:hypothetical protein
MDVGLAGGPVMNCRLTRGCVDGGKRGRRDDFMAFWGPREKGGEVPDKNRQHLLPAEK